MQDDFTDAEVKQIAAASKGKYPERAGRRARSTQDRKPVEDSQKKRAKPKRRAEEEAESQAKRTKSAPTENDGRESTEIDYTYGELGLGEQPESLVEAYLQDSSAYEGLESIQGTLDFTGEDIFSGIGLSPSEASPEPYAVSTGGAEAQSHRGGYPIPATAPSSHTSHHPLTLPGNAILHIPNSPTLPAWQTSDAPFLALDYRNVNPTTDQAQLIVSIALEITAQHLRSLLHEITGVGAREMPNFPGQSYNTTLRAFQRALNIAWRSSGRTGPCPALRTASIWPGAFPELDFSRPYCGLTFEGER